jgi:hypothetical protein
MAALAAFIRNCSIDSRSERKGSVPINFKHVIACTMPIGGNRFICIQNFSQCPTAKDSHVDRMLLRHWRCNPFPNTSNMQARREALPAICWSISRKSRDYPPKNIRFMRRHWLRMARHMHGRMHPTDLISCRKAFPARQMLGSARPTELISRPMPLATRICSLCARIWRLLAGILDGRARATELLARN